MENSATIEAILKRAIALEEESMAMYTMAAGAVKNPPVRKRLEEMADIERGHKARLEEMLTGNIRWAIRRAKAEPVTDLRLTDHLEARPLGVNADYQDVLLVAAQREKAAHEFYQAMAELVDDKLAKSIFDTLATEELRHKWEVEKIYEEIVYQAF
jgi:rubrerythrin